MGQQQTNMEAKKDAQHRFGPTYNLFCLLEIPKVWYKVTCQLTDASPVTSFQQHTHHSNNSKCADIQLNTSFESIWKGRSSTKGTDHLYYATKRQIENKNFNRKKPRRYNSNITFWNHTQCNINMKTLLRSNLLANVSCLGHHPSQIHSFLHMSEFQWERSWPAATHSNSLIFIKRLPSECIGCNLLILKVQNLKQGSTCQYRF